SRKGHCCAESAICRNCYAYTKRTVPLSTIFCAIFGSRLHLEKRRRNRTRTALVSASNALDWHRPARTPQPASVPQPTFWPGRVILYPGDVLVSRSVIGIRDRRVKGRTSAGIAPSMDFGVAVGERVAAG